MKTCGRLGALLASAACTLAAAPAGGVADASADLRLVILDPGHFHAALFQKEMLPGIAPRVHVYAPCGPDLTAHLGRVFAFNQRAENPTRWEHEVHASDDCMARLIAERPGNLVVLSGNNRGKIQRMEALVRAGMHTLADKPWIIEPEEFAALERTQRLAREKRVAIYDAMTERYEITCLLQRELVNDPAVFGQRVNGSLRDPAVLMQSVHFLKKEVAGAPLLRPGWFFDSRQLGEPLADVGTHLVDQVQWTLSPERPVDYRRDIAVLGGSRGWIELTREQFRSVTGLGDFPRYLGDVVRGDRLPYVAQSAVDYTLRGVHVQLDVRWEFEAPPGQKDTKFAVFRGSRARVEIRQGRAENYVPEVYVVPVAPGERGAVGAALRAWLGRSGRDYPGLALQEADAGAAFRIVIPAALRVSHEAHFALLVRQFLVYQRNPDALPDWEAAYQLAKYCVTTAGVRLARATAAGRHAAAAP